MTVWTPMSSETVSAQTVDHAAMLLVLQQGHWKRKMVAASYVGWMVSSAWSICWLAVMLCFIYLVPSCFSLSWVSYIIVFFTTMELAQALTLSLIETHTKYGSFFHCSIFFLSYYYCYHVFCKSSGTLSCIVFFISRVFICGSLYLCLVACGHSRDCLYTLY